MKTFVLIFTASISLALPSRAHGKTKQSKSIEPAGYVLVEEETSVDMNRLPLLLMNQARQDFAKRNFGDAAADLRSANDFFRVGLGARTGLGLQKSKEAEIKTTDLAQNVKNGKVSTAQYFDQQLAQIMYLKAESDSQRASDRSLANAWRAAGYDLQLASDELRSAQKWDGKSDDNFTASTLRDVDRLSKKLVRGDNWSQAEIKTAINNFNTAVRHLSITADSPSGTESATSQPAK